jgi:hypothetical protein
MVLGTCSTVHLAVEPSTENLAVEYLPNFVANLESRTTKKGILQNWLGLPYTIKV